MRAKRLDCVDMSFLFSSGKTKTPSFLQQKACPKRVIVEVAQHTALPNLHVKQSGVGMHQCRKRLVQSTMSHFIHSLSYKKKKKSDYWRGTEAY